MWILATTELRRERWAEENVVRQGYETKLPYFVRSTSIGRKLQALKPEILFPRYLMVLTSGEWRFLLGTRGVTAVVMSGESPAILPDSVIDELKARENADGFLVLPKKSAYCAGTPVRVTQGPLTGKVGIHEGMTARQRESILLDIMGRKVRTLLSRNDLEKVA